MAGTTQARREALVLLAVQAAPEARVQQVSCPRFDNHYAFG